jgi:hypothetical protein
MDLVKIEKKSFDQLPFLTLKPTITCRSKFLDALFSSNGYLFFALTLMAEESWVFNETSFSGRVLEKPEVGAL